MKKLFLLTLFVSSIGYSQKFLLGPQLGMNLVNLDSEEHGKNFHPGWYGGAAFDYQILDWFAIQSGVFYSEKRQAYWDSDTTPFTFFGLIDSSFAIEGIDLNTYTKIEGRTAQHYFDIPLMASFNYKGLTAGIGGYVGFMFNARKRQKEISNTPFIQAIDLEMLLNGFSGQDSSAQGGGFDVGGLIGSFLPKGYTEDFTESTDKSDLRPIDYGFRFNLGYQPNQFGFHAYYQMGLKDYRTSLPAGAVKQTHHFFQFSIRYMFGLDEKYGRVFGNSQM